MAHRPEEAAHLGERCAAGLLDAPESVSVLLERLRKLVPDGADLEHHHADGVGDDIVEFARNAGALLGNRDPGRRLALALGVCRAFFCGLRLHGSLAQRIARQPADREQQRCE